MIPLVYKEYLLPLSLLLKLMGEQNLIVYIAVHFFLNSKDIHSTYLITAFWFALFLFSFFTFQ